MHPNFSQLTPRWFKRAFVYTGNIDDFRYTIEHFQIKTRLSAILVHAG